LKSGLILLRSWEPKFPEATVFDRGDVLCFFIILIEFSPVLRRVKPPPLVVVY